MFAWSVKEYGDYRNVMEWREVETPQPGENQAQVKIHASGVSFANILSIQGQYQIKEPLPFIPGNELAGEITAVGPGHSSKVGDRVMGYSKGTFGEYALLDNSDIYPMPDKMTFEEGPAYLNSHQTSYVGLVHHGWLQAGEWLLVHGAAGAVGLAAVQIGKALGARVIATASSPEKLEVCLKEGADYAIDYDKEDFVEAVNRITEGHGADVIYDPVGGDVFDLSRRCIAFRGRLIVVGFAAGRIPEIAINRLLLRTFTISGFTLNTYRKHAPHLIEEAQDDLFRLYNEGKIRPVLGLVLPMSEAVQAIQMVVERRSIGRVVLVP